MGNIEKILNDGVGCFVREGNIPNVSSIEINVSGEIEQESTFVEGE